MSVIKASFDYVCSTSPRIKQVDENEFFFVIFIKSYVETKK